MNKMILFLQNAWSPYYAGRTWERNSWLTALEKSRSGQRLKILIDDFQICENTTPIVGETPSSILPPDIEHIRNILDRKPKIIIACGKQAEKILLRLWDGALLAVPHPAHRFLTDELYKQAKDILSRKFIDRVALRQQLGFVRVEILDKPESEELRLPYLKRTTDIPAERVGKIRIN